MNELIKLLSSTPSATSAIVILVSVIILSLIMMVLIAFFQGREIIFWPPKIGQHPIIIKNNSQVLQNEKNNLNNSNALGIAKIKEGKTEEDFLEIIDKAKKELWLMHLSGYDSVRIRFDDIMNWCKKPETHSLKVMFINPENSELLKSLARNESDIETYSVMIRHMIKKFKNAQEGIESLSKEEGKKIEIKTYDYSPVASIVAADPNNNDGLLFIELSVYFTSWRKRPSLILSNGEFYNTYINAYKKLWEKGHPI